MRNRYFILPTGTRTVEISTGNFFCWENSYRIWSIKSAKKTVFVQALEIHSALEIPNMNTNLIKHNER